MHHNEALCRRSARLAASSQEMYALHAVQRKRDNSMHEIGLSSS